MTASTVRLLCEVGGPQCDAHRAGDAGPDDKCPWFCDAPGCLEEATGLEYCPGHEALAAADAPPAEMIEASRKAEVYGRTLAGLLREAIKLLPVDPGA